MDFLFDEQLSQRLAEGLNHLEKGNSSHGTPSKIFHIKDFLHHFPDAQKEQRGVYDEEWIPFAASKKLILVTIDRDFKQLKIKGQLYKKHKLGVIWFKSYSDSRGYWNMVTQIISNWGKIKDTLRGQSAPFVYFIDKKGIQRQTI